MGEHISHCAPSTRDIARIHCMPGSLLGLASPRLSVSVGAQRRCSRFLFLHLVCAGTSGTKQKPQCSGCARRSAETQACLTWTSWQTKRSRRRACTRWAAAAPTARAAPTGTAMWTCRTARQMARSSRASLLQCSLRHWKKLEGWSLWCCSVSAVRETQCNGGVPAVHCCAEMRLECVRCDWR